MQKNGLDVMMLWVYENPWHFSANRPLMRMTGEFEDFKSEIVARLAEHLIIRAAGDRCGNSHSRF